MIEGLMQALQPSYLMWLTVGVLIGMLVGTLPGLTATMGTALLVPFTFALPTGAGVAMLVGLYVCAMFSDAIPAVLVNTPGTPAAMATAFDGHPMVLQGRGQEAIVGACFSADNRLLLVRSNKLWVLQDGALEELYDFGDLEVTVGPRLDARGRVLVASENSLLCLRCEKPR